MTKARFVLVKISAGLDTLQWVGSHLCERDGNGGTGKGWGCADSDDKGSHEQSVKGLAMTMKVSMGALGRNPFAGECGVVLTPTVCLRMQTTTNPVCMHAG